MSAVKKSVGREKANYVLPNSQLRDRQKKIKKSSKVEYIRFSTRMYRTSFHIIFTVLLIFTGGVGTAFTFAYLQDMRRQIENERAAIHQKREVNAATRAEIAQHLSINEIARIAQERLNMGPPDASQIVRIHVPRQSYVMQSAAPARTEPQGMWQSAWWYIRNWLGV